MNTKQMLDEEGAGVSSSSKQPYDEKSSKMDLIFSREKKEKIQARVWRQDVQMRTLWEGLLESARSQ